MTTETDGRVAAHTPGPWFRTGKGWTVRAPERPYVTASGTTLSMRHDVATVHQIGSYPGEREANARLIVAAPCMASTGVFLLARLDDFENRISTDEDGREFHGHVAPAIANFRAAIAKATGATS